MESKNSNTQPFTGDANQKAKEPQAKSLMHIKVHSPFHVYFDEKAYSISGLNATGPFDVLPGHHNFMALLTPCELIIRTASRELKIRISQGVMHVKADEVIVFLDV